MQRKVWTQEEDQVLKILYEKVKLNKWSLIARKMDEQYGLSGRTGKQCRERYSNHLNPSLKEQWRIEEEKELYRLHDQVGNKWAIIALRLGGRTDNGVKNHFFAKLRKAMRKMNKIIHLKWKKELKQIKLNVLYKIVQASQQRFKPSPNCSREISQFSCSLKNQILAYAYDSMEPSSDEHFCKIVEQINSFSKNYKRKPKQLRRVSSQSSQIMESLLSIRSKSIESSDSLEKDEENDEEGSDDYIQHAVEVGAILQQKHQEQIISYQQKRNLRSKNNNKKQIQQEIKPKIQPHLQSKNMKNEQQMLLDSCGILEEMEILPPLPNMMRKVTSEEFRHEALQQDRFFFDDSRHEDQLPIPLQFNSQKKQSHIGDRLFH